MMVLLGILKQEVDFDCIDPNKYIKRTQMVEYKLVPLNSIDIG